MLKQYIDAIESSNIVSKTDIEGVITFVNDEFCKISGYSKEELIGKNHNIVRHPDVPASKFEKLWNTILSKKVYKSTVKNLSKDGNTFYVNTTIIPILDEFGDIVEFVAIRYDVTREVELKLHLERKEKEMALLNKTLEKRVAQQTEKLYRLNIDLERRIKEEIEKNREKQRMLLWQSRFASLGQMTANIAHQWRQPLTELQLILYTLKNEFEGDKKEEFVNSIYIQSKNIIKSMSETIDIFMNFFKPNKEMESFSLLKSLDDASALMSSVLKKNNIELVIESDNDNITLKGIPNELTQVFLNLFHNSREAFISRGIESNRKIVVSIKQSDRYISISVWDNAGGIAIDKIEQIFEPYFTTKHSSRGTGLGLFMSKMIIEKSFNGIIKVENRGEGAYFEILIPIRE